ncbi:hypothetical protein UPYG_G00196110 [Umbra pygmaea]|uniref:VLIG-type G domain-containing protein n=1 Tax=Umbra pygmaea TaxID=75934 RepID=A0ABD0WI25_UMBPY
MSAIHKISRRLSSKKKKTPVDQAQEVFVKLGLEGFWNAPLDPAAMLDISTWTLENEPPLQNKHLPQAFLQRLWLLSPQARSTCCQTPAESHPDAPQGETIPKLGEMDFLCSVNPLDLVTAVYMSANSFLQQEMTVRMLQCQFAVPLLLPPMTSNQPGSFPLWSLRGVPGQWRSRSPAEGSGILKVDIASTEMPLLSFVKLGHCSVSKSQVLNYLVRRPQSSNECFLHRGMEGGEIPRKLANGMVEICCYLPSGNPNQDVFPEPVVIANLRGDAATYEKPLSFLCQTSSAIVVFCGNLVEKEQQQLASLKGRAKQVIVIDLTLSQEDENQEKVVKNLRLNPPEGDVISGFGASNKELAERLSKALNHMIPDRLISVVIEDAAIIAEEIGLVVDEGSLCKKAFAQVEELLTGIENGATEYRAQQLPLQGPLWNSSVEEDWQMKPKQQQEKRLNPVLGLEHFLREMGLIFELTHNSPGSGTHNVLRLPSVAADLLLYGVPLELLDGDASSLPCSWVGCVLAEFSRRLPLNAKTRVLTSLGIHSARNSEVLSALFGVHFPNGWRGCTRGVYMLALSLPDNLKKDMQCDFLLIVDVEGLCSSGLSKQEDTLKHDIEMATMVAGLSDVILQNMAPDGDTEMQSTLLVTVNALLRTGASGAMPISQLLTQGVGLDCKLLSLQLERVTQVLETEAEEATGAPGCKVAIESTPCSIPCLIGPWQNISFSDPVDEEYSNAVLQLKHNLLEALKKSAAKTKATSVPEFVRRLCNSWNAVIGEMFPIGFENTEVVEAFCILCTELSLWERNFLEHMESWFMGALDRIITCKATALENEDDHLNLLKEEAITEVLVEINKIQSRLEDNLKKDGLHKACLEQYKPQFIKKLTVFQEWSKSEILKKLQIATEDHYLSTTLLSFRAVLDAKEDIKLHELLESSKINDCLQNDQQLEKEFDSVWSDSLSNFEFRPSEKEDITACVIQTLKENLIHRGLHKHLQRLNKVGKEIPSNFIVYDEHFGYRSRLKHMLEENNRLQRLAAHRLASKITEEYNNFVKEKSTVVADFSDSYITEVLEIIDKALKTNSLEIRSAFEVDLKVYLCSHACRDFQDMHNRYARDRNVLVYLNERKNHFQGEFIYRFRKRDQGRRSAQTFTMMVLKPAALEYINRPLGKWIMEAMVNGEDSQLYISRQAFNCSLLEELIQEDCFEGFLEYLLSYERFSLKRIQNRVVGYLTGTNVIHKWMQQRLGEVVGKMAAAVSQISQGSSSWVLSDTKLLLEQVCLTLEADGEVTVNRGSMEGPLFHITTEWVQFVTYLLGALAEMRLALSQELSQDRDPLDILQTLPIKPHSSLFNSLQGCDKQCPFCRAHCEVGVGGHEVHSAMLHRPKGLLSYKCDDSASLSHHICQSDVATDRLFQNSDTVGQSHHYRDYRFPYPDWHIPAEDPNSQIPGAYWKYVLVRFNTKFAQEYQMDPALLLLDWQNITKEEALESLRMAFHAKQC